jgi:GMP synthase-like glutamine amidotransferase
MNIHIIQHVYFEHPGYLVPYMQQQQFNVTYTKIFENTAFPALNDIDVLVIMGGPMGVYEEDIYPSLKQEKKFIRSAMDAGKKVLGICLGSQLVAEAAGARVYPHTEKEIGWWPVQLVKSGQSAVITKGFPDEFITFHWHGDTFDLPSGAHQLFKTNACSNQGFLIGTQVAAVQFHMEATSDLINGMIAHNGDQLIPAPHVQSEQQILQQVPGMMEQQFSYISRFFNNFLAL